MDNGTNFGRDTKGQLLGQSGFHLHVKYLRILRRITTQLRFLFELRKDAFDVGLKKKEAVLDLLCILFRKEYSENIAWLIDTIIVNP